MSVDTQPEANALELDQDRPIFVTQPSLPPLEEFEKYLQSIWESKILTNGGPFHKSLENALCDYLGVRYISLFSNGTLALITALRALDIDGEVITTPYSFIATAHSLLWNAIQPVFVDIDPTTYNLAPDKIEASITSKTRAILPVHTYGTPCDTTAIHEIASRSNLKIIYDAAHAFGVKQKHKSLLLDGDLSVVSFHATKVFNTFEGGAIISHSAEMKKHVDNLKNFGITGEVTVSELGINGKMSELNAALGLLQLKYVDQNIAQRRKIDNLYRSYLSDKEGLSLLEYPEGMSPNYSYFPVFISDSYHISRELMYEKLRDNKIYARRYFYPLLSQFPMYNSLPSAASSNLPVATKVASQVLCLPLSSSMTGDDVKRITDIVKSL